MSGVSRYNLNSGAPRSSSSSSSSSSSGELVGGRLVSSAEGGRQRSGLYFGDSWMLSGQHHTPLLEHDEYEDDPWLEDDSLFSVERGGRKRKAGKEEVVDDRPLKHQQLSDHGRPVLASDSLLGLRNLVKGIPSLMGIGQITPLFDYLIGFIGGYHDADALAFVCRDLFRLVQVGCVRRLRSFAQGGVSVDDVVQSHAIIWGKLLSRYPLQQRFALDESVWLDGLVRSTAVLPRKLQNTLVGRKMEIMGALNALIESEKLNFSTIKNTFNALKGHLDAFVECRHIHRFCVKVFLSFILNCWTKKTKTRLAETVTSLVREGCLNQRDFSLMDRSLMLRLIDEDSMMELFGGFECIPGTDF